VVITQIKDIRINYGINAGTFEYKNQYESLVPDGIPYYAASKNTIDAARTDFENYQLVISSGWRWLKKTVKNCSWTCPYPTSFVHFVTWVEGDEVSNPSGWVTAKANLFKCIQAYPFNHYGSIHKEHILKEIDPSYVIGAIGKILTLYIVIEDFVYIDECADRNYTQVMLWQRALAAVSACKFKTAAGIKKRLEYIKFYEALLALDVELVEWVKNNITNVPTFNPVSDTITTQTAAVQETVSVLNTEGSGGDNAGIDYSTGGVSDPFFKPIIDLSQWKIDPNDSRRYVSINASDEVSVEPTSLTVDLMAAANYEAEEAARIAAELEHYNLDKAQIASIITKHTKVGLTSLTTDSKWIKNSDGTSYVSRLWQSKPLSKFFKENGNKFSVLSPELVFGYFSNHSDAGILYNSNDVTWLEDGCLLVPNRPTGNDLTGPWGRLSIAGWPVFCYNKVEITFKREDSIPFITPTNMVYDSYQGRFVCTDPYLTCNSIDVSSRGGDAAVRHDIGTYTENANGSITYSGPIRQFYYADPDFVDTVGVGSNSIVFRNNEWNLWNYDTGYIPITIEALLDEAFNMHFSSMNYDGTTNSNLEDEYIPAFGTTPYPWIDQIGASVYKASKYTSSKLDYYKVEKGLCSSPYNVISPYYPIGNFDLVAMDNRPYAWTSLYHCAAPHSLHLEFYNFYDIPITISKIEFSEPLVDPAELVVFEVI
jgi:hypothetical protein